MPGEAGEIVVEALLGVDMAEAVEGVVVVDIVVEVAAPL